MNLQQQSGRTGVRRLAILSIVAFSAGWVGQAAAQTPGLTTFERTSIAGMISGVVQMGRVFKTTSGNYYQVAEPIVEVVVEVMPSVTVLRQGDIYHLIIEGFKGPVLCRKLTDVTESRLDGESEGFGGKTVFQLRNGQIWLQSDGYYHYHYHYAPEVLIFRDGAGYKLQLEGIVRAVSVTRLK